jgi:RNA polymerase sigma factor (sigma-70 family)
MPTNPINLLDDYAWKRIDFRVQWLAKSHRILVHDAEDLRQEFAAELVRAAPRFDPALSSARTFVNRVLDMHLRYVVRQRHSTRAGMRAATASLDAATGPVVNDPRAGERSELELAEAAMDLQAALDALPRKLRVICEELKHYPPAEVARRLRLHRGTLYRAIARIRAHLAAQGMNPTKRATHPPGRADVADG